MTCGDTITAAPGTYAAANFYTGTWRPVTCTAGNNVAWLQCATFDACKITANVSDGMWADQSYWGVQRFEVTVNTVQSGACFHAGPRSSAPANIHHIIFANNVANGCMGGGFSVYDRSAGASVDYIVYVGSIAYDTAQGCGECTSGFNIYQPIASDTVTGTHMYIAGNFAYSNLDRNPCDGTQPTDGEGIIFDTFDFGQGGGTPYTQQAVAQNNIVVGNGGKGILVNNNNVGGSQARFYIKYNTAYGNNSDSAQQYCLGNGEITIVAFDVQATDNLTATKSATGCIGDAVYALAVSQSNATTVVDDNYAYGVGGNNTFLYSSGSFAYGTGNVLGPSPSFANPAIPSAPSCSGFANVPACMATVIAGYTSTADAALSYGYQTPGIAQCTIRYFRNGCAA